MFSLPIRIFAAFFLALAPRRKMTGNELRILCLTHGGMGDAIDAVPLLNALRRFFPHAHLTVACDPAGAPIMEACDAVNVIIVLKLSRSPWLAALKNAGRLQNHDWAIAAKDDFDRRLALMTRLTNARVRVGFERRIRLPSIYFTDPVPLPESEEHQTETLMRLLRPLGMVNSTGLSVDLSLRVPDNARVFAVEVMSHPPFNEAKHYLLVNLTRTPDLKFREEDFIALIARLLNSTQFTVALVAAPPDQPFAFEIAAVMGSDRIAAVETPEALDLAAMLEHASFFITPEGPIAHLAAAVGTPSLVLWCGDSFAQRHSRGRRHAFVHAEPGEATIPLERVWQALVPFLGSHQEGIEQKMHDLMDLPPLSDFT
jgi:ADP-heptose:LPS heptosyltransferase